jgi:hypothetical protein
MTAQMAFERGWQPSMIPSKEFTIPFSVGPKTARSRKALVQAEKGELFVDHPLAQEVSHE